MIILESIHVFRPRGKMMTMDHSIDGKRKSSPFMDTSSRRFKEQKTQHVIAHQDFTTASVIAEEFASRPCPIPDASKDSRCEDPDIQGSGRPSLSGASQVP